jgi:flagellar protein FliO/FliZ
VSLRRWAVIAAAVSVITLALPALADPADAPAPPPPDTGTPLSLRPSKPVALATQPDGPSTGWKLAALLALAGSAAIYWRKRGRRGPSLQGELTIVRRASVGIRSELLVVNVEGQRLLIGVTPQSIQSLAILDHDEHPERDERHERMSAEAPQTGMTVGARVDALLGVSEERRPRIAPVSLVATVPAEGTALGQARGLLALRRQG